MDFKEKLGEKAKWELHKDALCYFQCMATYFLSHKPSKLDEQDDEEVRMNL